MKLAGWNTWCPWFTLDVTLLILTNHVGVPGAISSRLLWTTRLFGLYFLSDDLLDSNKMLGCIPGFKHVAAGDGVSRDTHYFV